MERQTLSHAEVVGVIEEALVPLGRREGQPRSWVETNRSGHNALLQALTRSGLRRLKSSLP